MVEVIGPNLHLKYTYDAFNRRLTKQNGTEVTSYLYSYDNEIGAVVNNEITELRLLGEGLGAEIGAAVYMEFNGKGYTPIHDRQGSVVVLLDEQEKPVESYRYDAFGCESCTAKLNPWRFSSKRTDEETGFVYFGRRYYARGQACKTAKTFDRVTKTTIEHEKKVLSCHEDSCSTFHVVQETHLMGETVAYSYDFAGRKVQEVCLGPSCKERIITYLYDAR